MVGIRGRVTGLTKGNAPRATARKARAQPLVDDEQRRRLIEACAFFRAEQFRECDPGHVREQDVQAAASEIDAVIRPGRKRSKR